MLVWDIVSPVAHVSTCTRKIGYIGSADIERQAVILVANLRKNWANSPLMRPYLILLSANVNLLTGAMSFL